MSTVDLDQILFSRAGWRLKFLIPLWMFQIAVLLCLMGIFAYRLAETFEHYEEHDKMGQLPIVEVVWEGTNVGFNLVSLVLNIMEISKQATERLTPFFMLATHAIKLTLAFAILGLDVVVYIQHTDAHYSIIALALDCGLLAATLATFMYALKTFRRLLKYEDYHMTVNSKPRVGNDGGLELGHYQTTSYFGEANTTQLDPPPPPMNISNGSEYPSQTAGFSKSEIDQAIGAEFGWSSPRGSGVDRSNSVVGSGTVLSRKAEQRQSWVSESGAGVRRDDDDDESETVRGSYDVARHQSVPGVIVSWQQEDEDDRQALLLDQGQYNNRAG
ncbi:hypothetical protein B0H63DRAFT_174396 [Podospora didyma]|uniref:Transmembrane protein n=1 Tax=Podospora didyma TaxID=330526 RepID=A0AAE0NNU2_9PEZI|nr:hypothetical protein B0H63DRAFT_174396 [Podospora didyma]